MDREIRLVVPLSGFLIACLSILSAPGHAGKILYETCVKNLGNQNAIQFQAALQAGGLFFKWSGFSAVEMDGKCVAPEKADLFKGESEKGTQLFGENLLKPVPSQGLMVLQDVDNGIAFNKTGNATSFGAAAAQDLKTALGKSARLKDGDPVIDIINDTGSGITITFVQARVGNSQDPLNLPIDTIFIPDGNIADVDAVLFPSGGFLAPGAMAEFSFPLGGALNWSFQYTYTSADGRFTDLLATSIGEPGSLPLAFAAFAAVALLYVRGGKAAIGTDAARA